MGFSATRDDGPAYFHGGFCFQRTNFRGEIVSRKEYFGKYFDLIRGKKHASLLAYANLI